MSSLRYSSMGVMRPPKPPCWRDFIVSSSPKSIHSDIGDAPDASSRTIGARSPVADVMENSRVAVSISGNKPSRLLRRPRARIHRTRSEHVIQTEDLPESTFTATLADTNPKGLRVRHPEGRLYVEENNKRCQSWLAGIEAAEPLDEVDYTLGNQSSSPQDESKRVHSDSPNKTTEKIETEHSQNRGDETLVIYDLQPGIDLEIPEETFVWDASRNGRYQSPCSDEEMSSACKDVISVGDCEKGIGAPECSQTVLQSRSLISPTRSLISSTRKLISPTRSPASPTRSPASPTRSPASHTCSPASPTRSPVSPTRSPASPTRSPASPKCSPMPFSRRPLSSVRIPTSPTHSPISRIRKKTPENVGKSRNKTEQGKYVFSSGKSDRKQIKCDKRTSDRKLHKLCCDYDNTDSSSSADLDDPKRHVVLDQYNKFQLDFSGVPDNNSSLNDSGTSLDHMHNRPLPHGTTETKMLKDSELWALNLSTCE